MPETIELQETAAAVASLLKQSKTSVVFVESCTCGLASGFLAQTSGISEWMCGCFVTYQSQSKQNWLGVDDQILREDDCVSERVSQALVAAALKKTPAAQLGIAVTGHLEEGASPEAPSMYVAIARAARGDTQNLSESTNDQQSVVQSLKGDSRPERLVEAATGVLQILQQFLMKLVP